MSVKAPRIKTDLPWRAPGKVWLAEVLREELGVRAGCITKRRALGDLLPRDFPREWESAKGLKHRGV